MQILLIAPCTAENEWKNVRSVFVFPPMALACLASVTPSRHQLTVIDETFVEVTGREDVDLVGISLMTGNAVRAYELSRRFRTRGIPVVLGGIHVSLCPDDAALHADAIVIGEGELLWPQIIDDCENKRLQSRYEAKPIDLSTLPLPDHSVFDWPRYRIPQTVMASRGCPWGCSFCATTQVFGRRYRARKVESVIEEIAAFPQKFFLFLDDNLFFNRKYARQLMTALIPLKKQWVGQSDFSIAEDEELLNLLKKAGCLALLVGFESVSSMNFQELGKPVKTIEDYRRTIQIIHKAGLLIQGSFIFGFDGDTLDIFQQTLDFIYQIGIDTANFCNLTPLPGTSMYKRYHEEGRMLSDDWNKFTRQRVVFQPKNMTPRQLAEGRLWTYRQFYSLPSMLRRMPFKVPHIFWFWLYNVTFRIGIKRSSAVSEYMIEPARL